MSGQRSQTVMKSHRFVTPVYDEFAEKAKAKGITATAALHEAIALWEAAEAKRLSRL